MKICELTARKKVWLLKDAKSVTEKTAELSTTL